MTETARRLLVECGACPREKVRVVPHGAPPLLAAPRRRARRRRGARRAGDRFLLSTFGLISPGKGLETAIEALPAIVERHPEVVYVIAGRTHPDVAHREGERYRLMLERRVLELGLDDHVEFDDRFLSIDELADLLAATDVFVTPYRSREQIASGALTFALAAGCGVVSTPYWYAQDMLASGAGALVPFDDPAALADAVCALRRAAGAARRGARRGAAHRRRRSPGRRSPRRRPSVLREAHRARAAAPAVGRRRPAAHEHAHRPPAHARRRRRDRAARARDHPEPRRAATASTTSRGSPSSRSRSPAAATSRPGPRSSTARSRSCTTRPASGGMRNFMGYDRRWLDEPHVGDHVGRSVWALGEILATAWIAGRRRARPAASSTRLVERSLAGDVSLRTAAYTVLGLSRLDRRPARARRPARCSSVWSSSSRTPTSATASDDWRWFEDELSYDNARLPQALIVGGSRARPRRPRRDSGSSRCAGSATSAASRRDALRLPGHRGRRRDEPAPGAGDEQPLDAAALVEAELAAFAVTGDPEHGARATRAFEWFLGRNRLQRPLYDFATGGCSDGLGERGDERQRRRRVDARPPPRGAPARCGGTARGAATGARAGEAVKDGGPGRETGTASHLRARRRPGRSGPRGPSRPRRPRSRPSRPRRAT